MSLFQQMHSEWQIALEHLKQEIDLIDVRIDPNNVTPHYSNIMRVFSQPISKVKVVIAGQDPYPGAGHAQGLAFSVTSKTLPASLKNIFRELSDDLNTPLRTNGDLSDWAEQGVFLLNRILSTTPGTSLAHHDYGWQKITTGAVEILGQRNTVGIFWGKAAQELKIYFNDQTTIASAHPSPLSAYRGFFGSKPFSRTNELLKSRSESPILWA